MVPISIENSNLFFFYGHSIGVRKSVISDAALCDNLPRLPVSESLMRTIIWILKQCGTSDVPSLDALRKTQKALWSQCGVPTISCMSIQGKNFCINDPRAIIRMVIFSAFLTWIFRAKMAVIRNVQIPILILNYTFIPRSTPADLCPKFGMAQSYAMNSAQIF